MRKKKIAKNAEGLKELFYSSMKHEGALGSLQLEQLCGQDYSQTMMNDLPPRLKAIFVGYLTENSIDSLQKYLKNHGFDPLYPRSLWEATLIYAKNEGWTLQEWYALINNEEIIKARKTVGESVQFFNSVGDRTDITLGAITKYVKDNSNIEENGILGTISQTQIIKDKLIRQSSTDSDDNIRRLINENLSDFSAAREKTRYYFCKYLMYFLDFYIDNYCKAIEKNIEVKKHKDELKKYMSIGTAKVDKYASLNRNKYSIDEIRTKLRNEYKIRLNGIYRSYLEFYFGFDWYEDKIYRDWVRILRYLYLNDESFSIKDLSSIKNEANRKQLADGIRDNHTDWIIIEEKLSESEIEVLYKNQPNWTHIKSSKEKNIIEKMSTDEILERTDFAWNNGYTYESVPALTKKGEKKYDQTDRYKGDGIIRQILYGTLDLDRSTLIAYLIFFGKKADKQIPDNQKICIKRLNEILTNCEFDKLDNHGIFSSGKNDRPEDNLFTDLLESKSEDFKQIVRDDAYSWAAEEQLSPLYVSYKKCISNDLAWQDFIESMQNLNL